MSITISPTLTGEIKLPDTADLTSIDNQVTPFSFLSALISLLTSASLMNSASFSQDKIETLAGDNNDTSTSTLHSDIKTIIQLPLNTGLALPDSTSNTSAFTSFYQATLSNNQIQRFTGFNNKETLPNKGGESAISTADSEKQTTLKINIKEAITGILSEIRKEKGREVTIPETEEMIYKNALNVNTNRQIDKQMIAFINEGRGAEKFFAVINMENPDQEMHSAKLNSEFPLLQPEGEFKGLKDSFDGALKVKSIILSNYGEEGDKGSAPETRGYETLQPQRTEHQPNMTQLDTTLQTNTRVDSKGPAEATKVAITSLNTEKFQELDSSALRVMVEHDTFGELDIKLVLNKGLINGYIKTPELTTADLIVRNMPDIINSLVREGLNIGSLSVSLKDYKGKAFRPEELKSRGPEGRTSAISNSRTSALNGYINIFI